MTGDGNIDGAGRRIPRRDMTSRPFPDLTGQQPTAILNSLREWAEGQAEDAIAWYLRDKAVRRRISRLLRGCAILLGVAGGVVPLASAAGVGNGASWGYVLLAMAGGCLAFDHFFGLSSAWMRDIATAQALQRALTEFRLDWATTGLRTETDGVYGPVGPEVAKQREELIRTLVTRTSELVEAETSEWLSEFRTNIGDLNRRSEWTASSAQPSTDPALRQSGSS